MTGLLDVIFKRRSSGVQPNDDISQEVRQAVADHQAAAKRLEATMLQLLDENDRLRRIKGWDYAAPPSASS